MILLAALLCNYGRGFCLIDVGTEGSASARSLLDRASDGETPRAISTRSAHCEQLGEPTQSFIPRNTLCSDGRHEEKGIPCSVRFLSEEDMSKLTGTGKGEASN